MRLEIQSLVSFVPCVSLCGKKYSATQRPSKGAFKVGFCCCWVFCFVLYCFLVFVCFFVCFKENTVNDQDPLRPSSQTWSANTKIGIYSVSFYKMALCLHITCACSCIFKIVPKLNAKSFWFLCFQRIRRRKTSVHFR